MKAKQILTCLLVTAITFVALAAQAQTKFYKANNTTALDSAGSWTNNTTAPTSADTVVWDNNVATAANCTNTIGSSPTWAGIIISNPVAPIKVSGSTAKTFTVGAGGIDLTYATQDLFISGALWTGAAGSWTMGSGRTLIAGISGGSGKEIIVQNDLAINGHFMPSAKEFRVNAGATLTIPDGALIEPISDTPFSVNVAGGGGTVTQTGGVVKFNRSTTSATVISIGKGTGTGTYNLNGGLMVDTNSNTSSGSGGILWVGDSGYGVLNVNGGDIKVQCIQLGNGGGNGTINLNSGTIRTTVSDLIIAKGTTSSGGNLNVYGGTLTVAPGNLVVGKGSGALVGATVYMNSGAVNVTGSMNIPDGLPSGLSATVTIDGGLMALSNRVNLINSGAANGTLSLNGGTLVAGSVTTGSGTGTAALNLNGGVLKASGPSGAFIAATVPAYVQGGAIIDSGNNNITIPAALTGVGSGGLEKRGSGALTLSGANTYSGQTTVSAGTLAFGTPYTFVGPVVVNDASGLDTQLTTNTTFATCPSLTLGTSPTGSVGYQFDLGTNNNGSLPVIYATNLTAVGTVSIAVTGDGLAGTIHLIQYENTVSGGGSFSLNYAQGVKGYVTNNTATRTVDLVVTGSLVLGWRGQVDANWNSTTANWWDLSNNVASKFGNGATTLFTDATTNSSVNVGGSVFPAAIAIANTYSNYTFSGAGAITGPVGLLKLGTGKVTMALTNTYTDDTVISNGTFVLGVHNAIPGGAGYGDTTLEGTLDMAGLNDTLNSLNGYNGIVNNSSSTPAVLTVSRHYGAFAGLITNSGSGNLTLNISGGGLVLSGLNNPYRGGTTNTGQLQLASEQSIGTGTLNLNGGALSWLNSAAHSITNPVTIGGDITLCQLTNGPLTFTRSVDFTGAKRSLTCNADVLLNSGMVNGGLGTKNGPATLTVKNANVDWGTGTMQINNGGVVFSNSTVTQQGNVRLSCNDTNGLARVVITADSAVTMNYASGDLRIGDSTHGAPGATNQLDISGSLAVLLGTGGHGKFQYGDAANYCAAGIANLLPGGHLQVPMIEKRSGDPSYTIFNFKGGTLSANNGSLGTTFMQTLDEAKVFDAGAIIDTGGFDISIGQSLLAGGSGTGGLTKQGLGALRLNGNNTYGGATLVTAGTLGGTGVISGPVTVQAAAGFAPGASIGTITINNTLTLAAGSTTTMEISKSSGVLTCDSVVGVTTLSYGGTLVIAKLGTDNLAAGDSFTLFTATTYNPSVSFSTYSLPTLPGGNLAWDTSKLKVDGSIQVIAVPSFGSVTVSGSDLVMSGSGGTPFATFDLVTSTDLSQPVPGWVRVGGGSFAADGTFTVSIPIQPATPARFFSIKTPASP